MGQATGDVDLVAAGRSLHRHRCEDVVGDRYTNTA